MSVTRSSTLRFLSLLLLVTSTAALGCASEKEGASDPESGESTESTEGGDESTAPTGGDETGDDGTATGASGDPGAANGPDPAAANSAAAESGVAAADPATPMHPVFDLVANRQLAHGILGGGLTVTLGAPEGGKYVRGSLGTQWAIRDTEVPAATDGDPAVPVLVPKGKRAGKLHIPVTAEQASSAGRLVVRLWNAVPKNEITFAINGTALSPVTVAESGWAHVEATVPAGTLKPGENEIALKTSEVARVAEERAGVGLAGLALLSAESAGEVALDGVGLSLVGGVGLGIDPGRGAAWYVHVPEGSALELEVVGKGGCMLDVDVSAATKPDASIAARIAASEEMLAKRVDLAPLAGEVARLDLRHGGGDCTGGVVVSGGLMAPGAQRQMPAAVPPPKYVVIWLIDTLRADHLEFYNPDTDVETPNLSKFVAESTLFERVYCEGNESKVSHASLFTGMLPIGHQHYRSSTQVRQSDELLPEAMRRAGMTTAGFVSNGYISDKWGFQQGWDRFVNTIREGRSVGADNLMRISRPWLEDHKDDPFFVYYGTIDPHVHYFRHKEFIDRYDPNDKANMANGKPFVWKVSGNQLADIAGGRLEIDDADKARMKALYKNEISFNDKHFGAMLEELDTLGIREQTMIFVVADHGEEFFEHGGVGHARTLYQHTVQIPLIAYYPPLFPAGHRVAEGADMIDIYYTIAKWVGLDPLPEDLQGGDLAMQAQGLDAGYPRPTTATMGSRRYAMRLADYKLVTEYNGEDKLHAILDDPWEATDLSDDPAYRDALRWGRDAFGLYITRRKQWKKAVWGVPTNLRTAIE